MGQKLNGLTDEDVIESIERSKDLLERAEIGERRNPASDHRQREYFELGACMYQQDYEQTEIMQLFKKSAELHLQSYESVVHPLENLWGFREALGLIVGFGTKEMRQRLGKIPESSYNLHGHKKLSRLSLYLRLMKDYADQGAISEAELDDLLTHCRNKGSDVDKKDVLFGAETLKAIINGAEHGMNENLNRVIDRHKTVSRQGSYRLLPEGLMCMEGMALAKLATEAHLNCNVQSPYLPLHLMAITVNVT